MKATAQLEDSFCVGLHCPDTLFCFTANQSAFSVIQAFRQTLFNFTLLTQSTLLKT